MDIAFCNTDETRDIAMEVHQRMHFDSPLVFAKMSPREKRETEIDRGRIQDIGGLVQDHTEIVFGIQMSCSLN